MSARHRFSLLFSSPANLPQLLRSIRGGLNHLNHSCWRTTAPSAWSSYVPPCFTSPIAAAGAGAANDRSCAMPPQSPLQANNRSHSLQIHSPAVHHRHHPHHLNHLLGGRCAQYTLQIWGPTMLADMFGSTPTQQGRCRGAPLPRTTRTQSTMSACACVRMCRLSFAISALR